MRKVLKWTGIVVCAILVLLLIAYLIAWMNVSGRLNKQYAVTVKPIPLRADSSMLAYGARLYIMKGCADCHGSNLAGKVFVDDPMIGRFTGSNLTKGKGGLPAGFDDKAWLMALRHGLKPDGRSLIVMPSYEFNGLADYDVASIIAWCKAQPAVDNEPPSIKIGPLGRVLSALGKIPLVPAEKVDHHYQAPAIVKQEVSAAYGKYLSTSCTGCHHHDLRGGDNPVPGKTPVADITAKGHLGSWTTEQFVTTLRTGKTPEGKQLNNDDMPWKMTSQYTEQELEALYLYLRSL